MSNLRTSTCRVRVCLLLAVIATGCGVGAKLIRGSGVVASESRPASGFSAVSLEGIGTVRLRQTGTESLTVEAEENLLPLFVTTVENGTLRIRTKPNINLRATRPVVFHVTAARIDAVRVGGSGNIETGELNADAFAARVTGSGNVRVAAIDAESVTSRVSGSGGIRIGRVSAQRLKCDISGSGDARLAGRAEEVELGVSGSGSVQAEDLACRSADVAISGSGGARLGITEQRLTADVSGSGSLRYRGEPPVVEKHVSGSGSVSRGAG